MGLYNLIKFKLIRKSKFEIAIILKHVDFVRMTIFKIAVHIYIQYEAYLVLLNRSLIDKLIQRSRI